MSLTKKYTAAKDIGHPYIDNYYALEKRIFLSTRDSNKSLEMNLIGEANKLSAGDELIIMKELKV